MSKSILSLLFFLCLGMSITPRVSRSVTYNIILGLMLLCLCSWFGLLWRASLHEIFLGVLILGSGLFVVRFITQASFRKAIFSLNWRSLGCGVGAFCLLYSMAYLFLPTPTDALPLARLSGSLDLLDYVNVSQYILSLGQSNIAHLDYLAYQNAGWNFYQIPGVYCVLAWMGFLSNNNVMNGAMPMLYSVVACLGLMIMHYAKHFFGLCRIRALCVACLVLSGAFYQYIIGCYFLSSLLGSVIFLAFWNEALKDEISALSFGKIFPYWCLLFLFYPMLFVLNICIFYAVLLSLCIFNTPKKNKNHVLKTVLISVLVLFTLSILFYSQGLYFWHNFIEMTHRTELVWGMPLLSPSCLLGLPGAFGVEYLALGCVQYLVFFVLFLGPLWMSWIDNKTSTRIWILFSVGSVLLYLSVLFHLGVERYQPWKLASVFVLPLMGVYWAVLFKLLMKYRIGVVFFTLSCLMLNVIFWSWPKAPNVSKNYEKLSLYSDVILKGEYALQKRASLPSTLPASRVATFFHEYLPFKIASTHNQNKFQDLWVKTSNTQETFLSVFFMPHKKLHLLSPSYYPSESLKTMPQNAPFLWVSGNQIDLNWGLPNPKIGMAYSFKQGIPFVEFSGIDDKNWSQNYKVTLRIYVNQSWLKAHSKGIVRLQLKPWLSHVKAQKVLARWGAGRISNTVLDKTLWLDFSWKYQDWVALKNQNYQLELKITLPNAQEPSHKIVFYHLNTKPKAVRLLNLEMVDNDIASKYEHLLQKRASMPSALSSSES